MSDGREAWARAFFPRTTENTLQERGLMRGVLAGILDAASLPGRGYAATWNRYNEPILEGMARTGADPNSPLALSVAEGMARDPLTMLSAPVGGLAGSGGRALASGIGSALLRRAAPVAADAAANAGLSALAQYGTEGRVDPGTLAANAGLGLGMQGLGSAVAKMAPKAKPAVSYRFTSKDTPMSDWGHAMFADDRSAVSNGGYGKNEYHVPLNELTSADDIEDAIREAWENRDLSRTMNVSEAKYYGGLSADDIVDDLVNVDDIVNTAKGYDSPLVSWLYESVIDPMDIKGIKTRDGAVVFDPSIIKKAGRKLPPSSLSFAGGQSPIAGANALAGKYFRGMANGSSGGDPVVTDQKQYDTLPAGAAYRDASGRPHIKGGAK